MFMIIFIIIAVKPNVMISSFAKGTCKTVPEAAFTGCFACCQVKNTNSKNAMLHINVNLEKNETTFIRLMLLFKKYLVLKLLLK